MEEANGENLRVDMESQQKECDSLRMVTRLSESGQGRLGGKKRMLSGKEPGVPGLKLPRVCSKELFSLRRSQPCVVSLHFRYSVLSQADCLSRIYTKVRGNMPIM